MQTRNRILVLVHGFNVKDPTLSIERTSPNLADMGYTVLAFHYGKADLVDVRWGNENIAYALLSQIHTIKRYVGDAEIIPVGHSNGCALIHRAGELQAEPLFTRQIYISPALNKKTKLAPMISRCDVLHNLGDTAVRFGSLIPFHIWGTMGRVGYKGDDIRYINHDCSKEVDGHSDWFTPEKLAFTVGKVDQILS